jgi:Nif-specific regulatory protein
MLKKRLRLKTGELRLINEILKGFIKYGDLGKIFDYVLRNLYGFWNVEHSFIALYDGRLGELKVQNAFGFLPEEIERAIYSAGEGIVGQTYKLGIPLFATEDELLNKTGLLNRLKHKSLSLFTAPIKSAGKTLGVIAIFKEPNGGDKTVEKTLETLAIIGSVLGTFIHLRENFEREREEKSAGGSLIADMEVAKYGLVGVSEAAENLRDLIRKVAETDVPVLISGEEGTGKTLIAKIIHLNSPRRDGPFNVLDLRNTPKTLAERELFGVPGDDKRPPKKGLLELSDGGTLTIRHVELLPVEVQKRLLDFIKSGEITSPEGGEPKKLDVRILATTTADLAEMVKRGEFLAELYDLLSLVEIKVPPLSERMEDIPILVRHILKKYNRRYGKNVKLEEDVIKILTTAELRENIKELDRIIHRLVILSSPDGTVNAQSLRLIAPNLFKSPRRELFETSDGEDLPLPQKIEEEERKKIIWALERTNYIKSRAAKLLGYTLRQLDYRIKKYGIEVKRRKS